MDWYYIQTIWEQLNGNEFPHIYSYFDRQLWKYLYKAHQAVLYCVNGNNNGMDFMVHHGLQPHLRWRRKPVGTETSARVEALQSTEPCEWQESMT